MWSAVEEIPQPAADQRVVSRVPTQSIPARSANDEDAAVASMAFPYGTQKIGAPGLDSSDNTVEVIDIPAQDVVSIGIRGRMSAESLERGHRALLSWLKDHESRYRVTGPLRQMGYNSPFIPEIRAFFELQIPVKAVDHPSESVVLSDRSQ